MLLEIYDLLETANVLNNDLRKICKWAKQRTMVFNPDPTKQAQEVIFSSKSHFWRHPDLYFNNGYVVQFRQVKRKENRLPPLLKGVRRKPCSEAGRMLNSNFQF